MLKWFLIFGSLIALSWHFYPSATKSAGKEAYRVSKVVVDRSSRAASAAASELAKEDASTSKKDKTNK